MGQPSVHFGFGPSELHDRIREKALGGQQDVKGRIQSHQRMTGGHFGSSAGADMNAGDV
jgi:hypothetical protein